MSKRFFTHVVAVILVTVIVTPVAFLSAPKKASASSLSCIGGLLGIGAPGAAAAAVAVPVSNPVISGATVSSAGSTGASCINDVILIPLARAAIRSLLQQMTASVVNWINGANGTGHPSYVQNSQGHFQGVGDSLATSFFSQFAASIASPFAAAIASSLRANYLQQTSAAGFWAANECTLPRDLDEFLFGNWSQGGVAAWFALTTQVQNNPYTLYQASVVHLSDLIGPGIGGAIGARAAELAWGSGFLSWCGAAGTSYTPGGADGSGVRPGDACKDSAGNPGTIKTPGSVVHDYTQKALVGSPFEQLISATDLDNSFDAIVGALLGQVLGGVGGLFGASNPSYTTSGGTRPALTTQLQTYSSSNQTATQSASQTAQSILTQISAFTNAWQTISNTASAASSTVTSLASFCTDAANTAALALLNSPSTPANAPWAISGATADLSTVHSVFIDASRTQAIAAQTANITEIAPLPVQAQAAISSVAATQALAFQVQSEASTIPIPSSLASDIAVLSAMPPSITDVANAQQNAQVLGGAKASPSGSLTVSGGSILDQLNLISTNAATHKTTVCNPASSLYVTNGGSNSTRN